MTLPSSQDVVTIMNREIGDPYQRITAVYWALSQPALQGVIDQVRTTLVELVAEMRAGMPETADTPSAEVADQAVSLVVQGRGARISVNSPQARGNATQIVHHEPPSGDDGFTWRKAGAAAVGLATVAGVVIALAQWQGWGF